MSKNHQIISITVDDPNEIAAFYLSMITANMNETIRERMKTKGA